MGMSLVLAAYSSSMSLVFAADAGIAGTACNYYGKGNSKAFCTNIDEDGDLTKWACEKLPDGKNWTCVQMTSSTGSDIPPELRDAISKAQAQGVKPDMSLGESQGGNNTKPPKDLGAFNNGLNNDENGNGPEVNPGE